MARNAANEGQVKERARVDRLREKQHREDITNLLKTPAFRRVLWNWLEFTGIYRETFDTNFGVMAKNEGRRSVGLMLVNDVLGADPTSLIKMMQEHGPDQGEEET